MGTQKCNVVDCARDSYARGWCPKHYTRWRQHGDPNVLKHVPGNPVLKFQRSIDRTGDCWIWTAAKSGGYGTLKVDGRTVRANRYSLFLATGRWPERDVLHSCDNPACVNPAHLREGSHVDNMKEAAERGRFPRGASHKNAKLTEKDIPQIRALLRAGVLKKHVAAQFGVSPTTIWQITVGKAWKHA